MISLRFFFRQTMKDDRDALDRLYRDVFGGDSGRRVIADLFNKAFWNPPEFAGHRGDKPYTLNAEELAYFRGQQDLVRYLARKAGVGEENLARAFARDDLAEEGEDDGED